QSVAYLNEYSDPVAETMYSCVPGARSCNLNTYFASVTDPVIPVGLQRDGISYLTRENLGVDTFEGLPVQRSRETFTFFRTKTATPKPISAWSITWTRPL